MRSEYQKRATRHGIFLANEFYRPAKLPDPRAPRRTCKLAGRAPEQLMLNFNPGFELRPFFSDRASPLKDVFPEAYVD